MEFDINRKFTTEAEILKVLGHPIRLKIVAGLCTRECNVKHIWECLGLPHIIESRLKIHSNTGRPSLVKDDLGEGASKKIKDNLFE